MAAYWNEIEDPAVWDDIWTDQDNGRRFVEVCVGERFEKYFSVAYELTEEGDEHLKKQRAAAYKDVLDGLRQMVELVERAAEKRGGV